MDHRVFITLLFVLSGTANVILIKWMSIQMVEGSDRKKHSFQHPVAMTLLMFLAEFLFFGVYKLISAVVSRRGLNAEQDHILTRGSNEFHPLVMLLPAFLRTLTSILLFTGLYLTYATSFQMIRGLSLIFVGLFSTMYLNQTLSSRHWLAIFTMTCGIIDILALDVQRVDYDYTTLHHKDHNTILTGDLLVIIAEILHAFLYVYEEKHLKAADLKPIQASGWQGFFGIIITALAAVCLNFVPSAVPFNEGSRGVFDDLTDIIPQLRSNIMLILALIGFACSCAIYNCVGMSIAKFSSSGNRLLADGIRVYFIWAFVIFAEWEIFNLITILGLLILQTGIVMYRQAIFLEWYRSTLARWQRIRYMDMNADAVPTPSSQPADVI
ncbi:solute carrier family 35 member F6 [Drosophila sulfurigaster albostrigata]|uniref:solute carrier family 35 member F6 n=1 Tax=Drosophila sulfurigaster albostrigata TaxID=89887 RepID=UPI002D21AAED|nr:solute carrier family 35 member F6 [Drosophila sulfurigaster albostrigata]